MGIKEEKMKMKQAILKDGRKMRFVGGIPKEYESQIEHIIDIPEGDELKVPELVKGKLTMRDKTQTELDAEQVIKDELKAEADKETLIAEKIRQQAIDELKVEGRI